jgi:hypothetical protein
MAEYNFYETKIVGGRKRKIYKKNKSRKLYLKKKGKFIQLDKKRKGGNKETIIVSTRQNDCNADAKLDLSKLEENYKNEKNKAIEKYDADIRNLEKRKKVLEIERNLNLIIYIKK